MADENRLGKLRKSMLMKFEPLNEPMPNRPSPVQQRPDRATHVQPAPSRSNPVLDPVQPTPDKCDQNVNTLKADTKYLQPDKMSDNKRPGKLKSFLRKKIETPDQQLSNKSTSVQPLASKGVENRNASPIFERPLRLVYNEDGKTMYDAETLQELSTIDETLNVVAVVGSLRTGKSFLLSKLAEVKGQGFKTGHTTKAETKGIWIMCRPHPSQAGQVLALLDTEGIDDPDKSEITDDQWIFILSSLLSSTLVYNTKGHFDRSAIDKFRFLSCIKTSISVAGSSHDDSILDFFFPNFVLALRDFTLQLEEKTPEVFLEYKLKLQRGTSESIRNFNKPRQLISKYFKKRRCFIFPKPTKRNKLNQLMSLQECDLKQEFQDELNSFRQYIFSREPKSLKSGRGVNGRMFVTLLKSYVASIQNGETPCIQMAMETMAKDENKRAVDCAAKTYDDAMKKYIASFNTPSNTGLGNVHKDSMKAALLVVKENLVFDDKQFYYEEAECMFQTHLDKFKEVIDKNSSAMCLRRLNGLNMRILKKLKNRAYCHPAGYDEYLVDINWIIKQYSKDAHHLGTQALPALVDYLEKKKEEEDNVYQLAASQAEDLMQMRERIRQLRDLIDENKVSTQRGDKETDGDDEIEKALGVDIATLHVNGMKSICEEFNKMLEMKTKYLERVKTELTDEDPYYQELKDETEYWKTVSETATWNRPCYQGFDSKLLPDVLNGIVAKHESRETEPHPNAEEEITSSDQPNYANPLKRTENNDRKPICLIL